MDVEHPARVALDELRRQDAHEAGEHDEVRRVRVERVVERRARTAAAPPRRRHGTACGRDAQSRAQCRGRRHPARSEITSVDARVDRARRAQARAIAAMLEPRPEMRIASRSGVGAGAHSSMTTPRVACADLADELR